MFTIKTAKYDAEKVPECFLACAKFILVRTDGEDVIRADGPASSRTAPQQEIDGLALNEPAELMQWMSVVDEQDEDVAGISCIV